MLLRTGLTCHCNSDSDCPGETQCTNAQACVLQKIDNVVEQRCLFDQFDSIRCQGLQWKGDNHFCCTTPLCNDLAVLLTTTLAPQKTTPLTQILSTAIVSHPSVSTVATVISVTSTVIPLAIENTRGQSSSSTYMSPMRTTTTTASGICVCVLRDLFRCIVVRYSVYMYIMHTFYISIVVP